MGVLEEIERSMQRAQRVEARSRPAAPWYYGTLLAFCVVPCATMQGLFVPLLGQSLVMLASVLTCYYLWIARAGRLLLGALFGSALAALALILLSKISLELIRQLLYPLAGVSTAVLVAYIIIVAGAIAARYEGTGTTS